MLSTLTSKGQTTIPKPVRERLGLRPGDRIEYVFDAEGRLVLLPATRHIDDLAGMLHHGTLKKPVSVEAMNEAIREGAARQ